MYEIEFWKEGVKDVVLMRKWCGEVLRKVEKVVDEVGEEG